MANQNNIPSLEVLGLAAPPEGLPYDEWREYVDTGVDNDSGAEAEEDCVGLNCYNPREEKEASFTPCHKSPSNLRRLVRWRPSHKQKNTQIKASPWKNIPVDADERYTDVASTTQHKASPSAERITKPGKSCCGEVVDRAFDNLKWIAGWVSGCSCDCCDDATKKDKAYRDGSEESNEALEETGVEVVMCSPRSLSLNRDIKKLIGAMDCIMDSMVCGFNSGHGPCFNVDGIKKSGSETSINDVKKMLLLSLTPFCDVNNTKNAHQFQEIDLSDALCDDSDSDSAEMMLINQMEESISTKSTPEVQY